MQVSTNFEFMKDRWPELAELASFAETYAYTDPASSLVKIRIFSERLVDVLYYELGLRKPYQARTFREYLDGRDFRRAIPSQIIDFLHFVRKEGNKGAHEAQSSNTSDSCLQMLENTHKLALWFYRTITKQPASSEPYRRPEKPISAKKLQEEIEQREARIKQLEEEQTKKRNEHPKADATEEDLERTLVNAIVEAETVGLTEAETRKQLIDSLLEDAGWTILNSTSQYSPSSSEAQCIKEYSASKLITTKSGTGFIDYVLMGKSGLPIAVVEAKKTAEDAESGKTQAEDYANGIEKETGVRPFIYYTNGHDIFFWDDLSYPERRVWGFFDLEKLEYLLFQRSNQKSLAEISIKTSIVDRDYQLEAIRRVFEDFELERRRSALLVMATGTGKTRVAMSIIDGLMRANWVKRVLFLVDRLELQDQAKDAFSDHIPDVSVSLVGSSSKDDPDARVYISTYPAMMNAFNRFNVGFFDLVIADESHRSIYKYYKEIFEYFDGLRLGLTATPIDYVQRNTYLFFGRPNRDPSFYFSLDEAVDHKPPYLVNYTVDNQTTSFLQGGIKYDELTEEQREQLEEQDEEANMFDFSREDIDKVVMNKETNRMVLRNLMDNGIRNEDGTRPGKTIIFARNHPHGKLIETIFDEMYPQYRGKLAKLIDYKDKRAKELIKGFKGKNKEFGYIDIAISVDMLDTGIDVPEVVNLVYAKPIYSKVKFWQMLGRGTRLCKDLFGPGKDKQEFVVFDPWRNFEFFGENPDGFVRDNESRSVPERLFGARIELLNRLESTSKNITGKYDMASIVALIRDNIASLPNDSVTVRENWQFVEQVSKDVFWQKLDDQKAVLLQQYIKPLMRWRNIVGEADALAFDIKVSKLQVALASGDNDTFATLQEKVLDDVERLRTNLNQVKPELQLIQDMQRAIWWQNVTIEKLEDMRLRLRDLMRYRSATRTKAKVIDIDDRVVKRTLTGVKETPMDEYRERLVDVLQELKSSNLTLQKIRRGIAITEADLVALQSLIFARIPYLTVEQLKELYPEYSNSLEKLIRSLIGMDELTVRIKFDEFRKRHTTMNANQLQFLALVEQEVVKGGGLDLAKLYQQPFTSIHNLGLDGVFKEEEADEIVGLIAQFAV